ncbi:hypothetical protein J8F10_33015 [Gemmata sp. G18]|uniref:Uncharacterized protein n=1 Tax=Gemmata palustris TaxID=2822762 RepID=A0ABS5C261_9BACT|nr:hypothetical protein [Gemmata palustris]MBP3960074.1 hypothetical protein [Gemmata palustris]
MTGTKCRADEVRAHLDEIKPGWQKQIRDDLDFLTPGWETFPVLVWDDASDRWIEVVLLATPETVSQHATGLAARFRRWLGRK